MTVSHPIASPFPRCSSAAVALAFGPWLVRLSDVGPVAAGFWRLALALPFLFVIARHDRPAGRIGRGAALIVSILSRPSSSPPISRPGTPAST